MKRLVKKIAGTTLVLTMGVSGTALAADIDLTGMSLDELVELQNNIVAEIDSRTNVGKDVIPCGVNLKTGEVLYIYSGEMIIEESNASWMPDGN